MILVVMKIKSETYECVRIEVTVLHLQYAFKKAGLKNERWFRK